MTRFSNYNKKILILYLLLVCFGLLNLYDLDQWSSADILHTRFFKQCIWFLFCITIFFFIHFLSADFIDLFAYQSFLLSLILIFVSIILGRSVGGHHAWINIGSFNLQPGEFLKITCALSISELLSKTDKPFAKNSKTLVYAFTILGISVFSILLQGDLGSAMVFSSFIIPLYVFHLSVVFIFHIVAFVLFFILNIIFPFNFLAACIFFILLVFVLFYRRYFKQIFVIALDLFFIAFINNYVINNFLHQYHKDRIKVLFDDNIDKLGLSWNILQSKIAIGNGGLLGRGFGAGTQTKYNFIPAQQTDFIFCTIAEEYGFIGFLIYAAIFFFFILELLDTAEKQHFRFNKIFIYSISSILFFHFAVNIAMTSGLFPVVGIPLPFISYGGSSLLAFSLMVFITLKLDAKNNNIY
ncbi:MAG: rod shape-determining protein RodA [Cytophagales bacterium]|jgi:rod shape determining protein RodA|nr:rod shape-determining protein RodA [Cytophagales bacterium]